MIVVLRSSPTQPKPLKAPERGQSACRAIVNRHGAQALQPLSTCWPECRASRCAARATAHRSHRRGREHLARGGQCGAPTGYAPPAPTRRMQRAPSSAPGPRLKGATPANAILLTAASPHRDASGAPLPSSAEAAQGTRPQRAGIVSRRSVSRRPPRPVDNAPPPACKRLQRALWAQHKTRKGNVKDLLRLLPDHKHLLT